MNDKQTAKEKMLILKELRVKHADSVARTQAHLKQQNAVRKLLKSALKEGAKTIPEITEIVSLSSDEVLWHIVAMKKYDLVTEVGQDGEYYKYALPTKEKKS